MKRSYLIKILLFSVTFTLFLLYIKPFNTTNKGSNTVVLNDKPIDISLIQKSNGVIEIASKSSFPIDWKVDNISWINNKQIILSYLYPEDFIEDPLKLLNISTGEVTALDIEGNTSSYLVSPLGDNFLYNPLVERDSVNLMLKEKNKFISSKSIDYSKYIYYSTQNNFSKELPEDMFFVEWLPDGSGYIARSKDYGSIVTYNFETATTKELFSFESGFFMDLIIDIVVSKDGSNYYFSYLDSETGLYSIYLINKELSIPEKLIDMVSISGQFNIINDNLLVLTNPARTSIYTYDISNHRKYKNITTSSSESYISNDKSMLAFVEHSYPTSKVYVVKLTDPNFTPTQVFESTGAIYNISWSKDNALAILSSEKSEKTKTLYTCSFK